jgi:hypothetical protein
MVGAVRFELTTSCTRNKRATRLRYAPNRLEKLPIARHKCNDHLFLETSGVADRRAPKRTARLLSIIESMAVAVASRTP